jgi:hypothetical protein
MSKKKSMANESVVFLNSGKVIGFQAGGCYAWLGQHALEERGVHVDTREQG